MAITAKHSSLQHCSSYDHLEEFNCIGQYIQ
jgi:hypothetical protein